MENTSDVEDIPENLDKEVGWIQVRNNVSERVPSFRLVPNRKLQQRTKILNAALKKLHVVKSYSQYVKLKTAVLRDLPQDAEVDDTTDFIDEDYEQIYQSADRIKEYVRENSMNQIDLTELDNWHEEFTSFSESCLENSTESDSSHQTVMKKTYKGNKTLNKMNRTNSETEVQMDEQPKKLKTKRRSKEDTSHMKNVSNCFRTERVTNIAINTENEKKGTKNMTENNLMSTNNTKAALPNVKTKKKFSLLRHSKESKNILSKENVNINKEELRTSPHCSGTSHNDKTEECSQNGNAICNTLNKGSPNKNLEIRNNVNKKMQKSTPKSQLMEKPSSHSEMSKVESIKEKSPSLPKCNGINSTSQNRNNIEEESENEHDLSTTIHELVRDDSLEDIFSGETKIPTAKKNLNSVLDNCSILTSNKKMLDEDSKINESIEINKSKFRFSEINATCKSTPLPKEKTAEVLKSLPLAEQQEHSEIDDEIEEKSTRTMKPIINTLKNASYNDSQLPSPVNSGNEESAEQPTIVVKKNSSILQRNDDTSVQNDQSTFIVSPNLKDKAKEIDKPKPKITFTEIVNKEYKIIGMEDQMEENSKDDSFASITKSLTKLKSPEKNDGKTNNTEASCEDKQANEREKLVDIQKHNMHYKNLIDENVEEEVSASTKKKLQLMKRLDLTADSSSSEDECDENDTVVKVEDTKKEKRHKNKNVNRKNRKTSMSSMELSESEKTECNSETSDDAVSNSIKSQRLKTNNTANKNGTETSECIATNTIPTVDEVKEKDVEESDNNNVIARIDKASKANKGNAKNISSKINNAIEVEDQGNQTPLNTSLVTKRPNNLKEYIHGEELEADTTPLTFTIKDIYEEEEAFLIDIPKTISKAELLGQKVVLTNSKLKVGKLKYKIMYKDANLITCVIGSGKTRKPFKAINLRPVAIVVTKAKVAPGEESKDESPRKGDHTERESIEKLKKTKKRCSETPPSDISPQKSEAKRKRVERV